MLKKNKNKILQISKRKKKKETSRRMGMDVDSLHKTKHKQFLNMWRNTQPYS